MKRIALLFLFIGLISCCPLFAQDKPNIQIPDILGYKTLTCDFHMHTVFSDGTVWPSVRPDEARLEGLDVISITDHIENRRYLNVLFTDQGTNQKQKIIPDHNEPFNIAKESAERQDIILIKGAEITRSMPPGHHNALFLDDINPLDTPDWKDAFAEAKKQNAFIFWNHPGWRRQQPDTTLWWDEHTWLHQNGMMHGIEVVNGREYYPEAHLWAMEKNLTFLATSDVHGPIGHSYQVQKGEMRPMTLVFATERSEAAIREALFARRTLAYYDNKLIGDPKYLDALFFASVKVESVSRTNDGFQVVMSNHTDIAFQLSKAEGNDTALSFNHKIELPAGKQTTIKIYAPAPQTVRKIDLKLTVDNLLAAPLQGLPVSLTFHPE